MAVLESSSVDERGLAKTIMDKYCPNNSRGICNHSHGNIALLFCVLQIRPVQLWNQ